MSDSRSRGLPNGFQVIRAGATLGYRGQLGTEFELARAEAGATTRVRAIGAGMAGAVAMLAVWMIAAVKLPQLRLGHGSPLPLLVTCFAAFCLSWLVAHKRSTSRRYSVVVKNGVIHFTNVLDSSTHAVKVSEVHSVCVRRHKSEHSSPELVEETQYSPVLCIKTDQGLFGVLPIVDFGDVADPGVSDRVLSWFRNELRL